MKPQFSHFLFALLSTGTLLAQTPSDRVRAGLLIGISSPLDTNKMELSSVTLSNNGINQKSGADLGAAVDITVAHTWSTRWGVAYTLESPTFPVNLGNGTLAPRNAKRNQCDIFGQGMWHATPSWYGIIGFDYVCRTLKADGTDLDTFKKAGFTLGTGYTIPAGKLHFTPEVCFTKAGMESQLRFRVGLWI